MSFRLEMLLQFVFISETSCYMFAADKYPFGILEEPGYLESKASELWILFRLEESLDKIRGFLGRVISSLVFRRLHRSSQEISLPTELLELKHSS